jgi:hypothetical protein
MAIIQKENDFLKLELKKSEQGRVDLQVSIKETLQEMQNEYSNLQKNFNKLLNEKVLADDKNKDAIRKIDSLNLQIEKANLNVLGFEKDLNSAKETIKNLEFLIL